MAGELNTVSTEHHAKEVCTSIYFRINCASIYGLKTINSLHPQLCYNYEINECKVASLFFKCLILHYEYSAIYCCFENNYEYPYATIKLY